MYLLYLDESGTHPSSDRVVVGGVAVFERAAYWLKRDLSETVARFFPYEQQQIPIHAPRLRATGPRGLPEAYAAVNAAERRRLLDACYSTLLVSRHPVLFATVVDKDAAASGDAYRIAFEDVVSRFDLMLARFHAANRTQRGVVIMSESSTLRRAEAGIRAVRLRGHPVGPHPEPVRGPPVRVQGADPAPPGRGAGDQRGLGSLREGHLPALRRHAAEVRPRGDPPARAHPSHRGGRRLLVPRLLLLPRLERRLPRGRAAATRPRPVGARGPVYPGRAAVRREAATVKPGPRESNATATRLAIRRIPTPGRTPTRTRTASRNPTRTGPPPGIPDRSRP